MFGKFNVDSAFSASKFEEMSVRILPANIYLFNVNNRNTRKSFGIC